MNSTVDVIGNRRSIRRYIQRSVAPQIIKDILDAATWAPSAHNAQPWRFLILSEIVQKRVFAQAMAKSWLLDLRKDDVSEEIRKNTVQASVDRFVSAPVLIIACLTMQDMTKYPDKERQDCEHDLAVQSLSAAIQNLLLAAHDKGLGACWYCAPIFCKVAIQESLKIPHNIEPQALITLGYPAENPLIPLRKPVESIAYFGEWEKVK